MSCVTRFESKPGEPSDADYTKGAIRSNSQCVIARGQYPCGLPTARLSQISGPTSGMACPRDTRGHGTFVLTLGVAFRMASRLRRASSISFVSSDTRTRRAVLLESWTV